MTTLGLHIALDGMPDIVKKIWVVSMIVRNKIVHTDTWAKIRICRVFFLGRVQKLSTSRSDTQSEIFMQNWVIEPSNNHSERIRKYKLVGTREGKTHIASAGKSKVYVSPGWIIGRPWMRAPLEPIRDVLSEFRSPDLVICCAMRSIAELWCHRSLIDKHSRVFVKLGNHFRESQHA